MSDDYHHAVHALLTGERDRYYADFHTPTEQLVKAINDTFVYDGSYSPFRGRQHGAPVGDLTGDRFVVSVQTHDQVGNRAQGERLAALVEPAQLRLGAALLLLAPHVPLLFMGEEYGEERPFPFFLRLRRSTSAGRGPPRSERRIRADERNSGSTGRKYLSVGHPELDLARELLKKRPAPPLCRPAGRPTSVAGAPRLSSSKGAADFDRRSASGALPDSR